MKQEKTAIKFYKEIKEKKELNKYKLINGLFIIKYINEDICVYVGDFLKSGCIGNETKHNKVLITDMINPQEFKPKSRLAKTRLGIWNKLNIGFKETPIRDILK